MTRRLLPAARLLFALAAVGAVAVNLVLNLADPHFDVVNFFSFFTIWSNLFAAAVLTYAALGNRRGPRLDHLRGASVVFLALTGTVDYLLLSRGAHYAGLPGAVQFTLHRLLPVAAVMDWAIDPPRSPVRWRDAAAWLGVPLFFAAYSIARGAVTGWHPYGFFDPGAVGGYAGVAGWVAWISVGVLVIAGLVAGVGNLGRRVVRSRATALAVR